MTSGTARSPNGEVAQPERPSGPPVVEIEVNCPLEGLTNVRVTYNVMAAHSTANAFTNSQGERSRDDVITNVTGWDNDTHRGGPWGHDAPVAWLVWVAGPGYAEAIRKYVNNPKVKRQF